MTQKENGVETNDDHWELSADGKVLRLSKTKFHPGSPAVTSEVVASRMSGSNDFVGQWRDTTYLQLHTDMTVRLDSQAIHIGYPSAEQYIDAPFNGVGAAVRGPHAPAGLTYTARLVGRHEIHTLASRNGAAIIGGSLELSGDGKIIIESWWSPDRPSDKGTLVYDKK